MKKSGSSTGRAGCSSDCSSYLHVVSSVQILESMAIIGYEPRQAHFAWHSVFLHSIKDTWSHTGPTVAPCVVVSNCRKNSHYNGPLPLLCLCLSFLFIFNFGVELKNYTMQRIPHLSKETERTNNQQILIYLLHLKQSFLREISLGKYLSSFILTQTMILSSRVIAPCVV